MTGIPTIASVTEAREKLSELSRANEWVSVFWDKGWGDAPLEISIIVDGNGQQPLAHLTPTVYQTLLADGTIQPNSLETFKARKLHDYKGIGH